MTRRRITKSYFNYYAKRYAGVLKRTIVKMADSSEDRLAVRRAFDEYESEAYRSLVFALTHFDHRQGSALSTYLYARTLGHLHNIRMRTKRQTRRIMTISTSELNAMPTPKPGNPERTVLVEQLLGKLTENERAVVTGLLFEGESLRRLGKRMGVCYQTVRRTYEQAIEKLRGLYAQITETELAA